jgi:Holliday junction resolvase-like predicted endonuclease
MIKTSKHFLSKYKIEDRPCRFDIVTIVLPQKGRIHTKHYENVFTP